MQAKKTRKSKPASVSIDLAAATSRDTSEQAKTKAAAEQQQDLQR